MKILNGVYNDIKIFTDIVDEMSLTQLQEMCDLKIFKDSTIRIMPDVHAGKGCTIGTTMTIIDKVIPNMVGVDIGCGMEVVQLKDKNINLAKLDSVIYDNIPSGLKVRKTRHSYANKINLSKLKCFKEIDALNAYKSIGTLGGGNHFIEVDSDEDGNNYLVVHSGSRHLGLEVATYYQNEGYKRLVIKNKQYLKDLIARHKAEGKNKDIEKELNLAKANKTKINKDMAYVEEDLFEDYIHDMKIVQEFAILNRKAMVHEIVKNMKLTVVDQFTTIHNYIDTDKMILRKGAVSAQKNEKLLIPINMRDGSLICLGKGNPDWNYSAPHGAGRLLSRREAKEILSLEEFEKEMEGIYSTSVNMSTLDESPMAYKKLEDIIDNIRPTVEIIKIIKPIYNFKASE